MRSLHSDYSTDEIIKAIDGKHDMATDANVKKLIALDLAGRLPDRVADAVRANFEEINNCVGEEDWQAVIDASFPVITVSIGGFDDIEVSEEVAKIINFSKKKAEDELALAEECGRKGEEDLLNAWTEVSERTIGFAIRLMQTHIEMVRAGEYQ